MISQLIIAALLILNKAISMWLTEDPHIVLVAPSEVNLPELYHSLFCDPALVQVCGCYDFFT